MEDRVELIRSQSYEKMGALEESFQSLLVELDSPGYRELLYNESHDLDLKIFLKEIILEAHWVLQIMSDKRKDLRTGSRVYYSESGLNRLFDKLLVLRELLGGLVSYKDRLQIAKEGLSDVQELMLNILNNVQGLKFDMLFSENFILQSSSPKEFRDARKVINTLYKNRGDLEDKVNEAGDLLKRMKLTEQAVLREGLTRSFRLSVDELSKRIKRFDFLNYSSLVLMFLMTLILFIDISKIEELTFISLKSVSIYERFLLIAPLVCLSWFASKRSQFLYQIKEEYSYKYATALAYEGYKDEIDKFYDGYDKKMRDKLMEVTIGNLARSPLEQFDKNTDHAPYNHIINKLQGDKE